jgi:hypothetical protein
MNFLNLQYCTPYFNWFSMVNFFLCIMSLCLCWGTLARAQENKPYQLSNVSNGLQCVWFSNEGDATEVGVVKKLAKVELGFRLPASFEQQINLFLENGETTGVNPYDPDELNFEALFIAPSGKKTRRFGFYYGSFVENSVLDFFQKDTTSFAWRVRFAADEIGPWKVEVQVTSKLASEPLTLTLDFSCTASLHKGRLCTSKTGTEADRYLYYSETGETFVAVSNNISSGGFYTYKPSQNKRQMKGVEQLIEVKGNFTRFDMQPQAALPDWPIYNNYDKKQDEMFAFDRMVKLCEENGVYFTIFRHHVELLDSYYNPGGPDWSGVSWYDNPYRKGLNLPNKKDYLTNVEAIEWQLKSLRYVFSRWGYSPNFSFYGYSEINNWYSGIIEEEKKFDAGFDEKEGIELMKNWFVNQKEYITNTLSKDVLFANSYSKIPDAEERIRTDGLFRHSDVIAIHDYETIKDVNYQRRYGTVDRFWNIYKKPVIVEEMGISDNKLRIYCCTGIEYHNSIWATALMGSFGTGMDWWWDRGVHDFGYYKNLRPVQTFFVDEDLRGMNARPQQWSDKFFTERRTIENFVLVSKSKERALGWVHNATFYWRNLESESPCIQELLNKSTLSNACFVGNGYDINSEGPGDYAGERFEDTYTKKGGAIEINNARWQDNPRFQIEDLKSSFGRNKHWYKLEFYETNGSQLKVAHPYTQTVASTLSGTIFPTVPNLDKVNPDYAYKLLYLGKSKTSPTP